MTLYQALDFGKIFLKENDIADWNVDAWYLLEHILHMDKASFLLLGKNEIDPDVLERYHTVLNKRAAHVPLQYITGVQEFMGINFSVTSDVLIPRMDTECLVLEAEKNLKTDMKVLDMCTGSGCIIISLKKRNIQIEAFAADISEVALEVARKNAADNEVKVKFFQSDLFTNIDGIYDMIISNPPYIPSEEVDRLMEEVRDYEPRIALDGTLDGLEYYRRITKDSYRFLVPGGVLLYEIGCEQADAVVDIMKSEGFINIKIIQDLSGLDRVVYGGKKDV